MWEKGLGIEIDITSRTQFENYQRLGVPELWRCTRRGLQINLLQQGNYVELINRTVEQNLCVGRSQAIREFKRWVWENL
ncbi:MAG: hypothetical protein Fur006_19720 [Coleofasciculaceae cyanobacterium]